MRTLRQGTAVYKNVMVCDWNRPVCAAHGASVTRVRAVRWPELLDQVEGIGKEGLRGYIQRECPGPWTSRCLVWLSTDKDKTESGLAYVIRSHFQHFSWPEQSSTYLDQRFRGWKGFHLSKVELTLWESFPENKHPIGARHRPLPDSLLKKIQASWEGQSRPGPRVCVCVCVVCRTWVKTLEKEIFWKNQNSVFKEFYLNYKHSVILWLVGEEGVILI